MSNLSRIATPLLVCFALSACGQNAILGENSEDPNLRGHTTITELFNGATTKGTHLTIEGSKLEPDTRYTYNGNVTINGDFPAKSRLDVQHGKIVVNGNVGDSAKLSTDLPIDTHRESYGCIQYNIILKMPMPSTCWKTVVDGLTFPNDNDPAITVNGHVGDNAKLFSNAGITIKSAGEDIQYTTGFDRPFTLGR